MAESKAQVGSSPFHTKGLVYQGAKDFYASRVPGGHHAGPDLGFAQE